MQGQESDPNREIVTQAARRSESKVLTRWRSEEKLQPNVSLRVWLCHRRLFSEDINLSNVGYRVPVDVREQSCLLLRHDLLVTELASVVTLGVSLHKEG